MTMYGDPRTESLLSLSRYAQIMNIDPIRFFGGYTALKNRGACDDVWFEYSWQDAGKVSRQEILLQIIRAEEEIARYIGFWPAPRWIVDEEHQVPQFFDRSYRDVVVSNSAKNIKLNYGYVIAGGTRATTPLNEHTRENDIDTTGDGYTDIAVWSIPNVDFDSQEIHAYIKEYNELDAENCRTDIESVGADVAWEIRDLRIVFDPVTSTATIYVPKWQLFKPQLQRQIDASAIDADNNANYVDDVIFYRVYNSPDGQIQCTNVAPCTCATETAAGGCLLLLNKRLGIVSVNAQPCQCVDKLLIAYYAGYIDPYARGRDKLSTFFATQIAKLATSRIPKKFCYCENIQTMVDAWQEDTTRSNDQRTYTIFDTDRPFGTRVGELEVYRALRQYGLRVKGGANVYL